MLITVDNLNDFGEWKSQLRVSLIQAWHRFHFATRLKMNSVGILPALDWSCKCSRSKDFDGTQYIVSEAETVFPYNIASWLDSSLSEVSGCGARV